MRTTDSHGADAGSFQAVLEGPGAEKLAKHMYKRDNEARFCRDCGALRASICDETQQRAGSSQGDQT